MKMCFLIYFYDWKNLGKYSLRNGVRNLNDINEILSIEFKLDFHKYLTLGIIENYTTLAIHHQKMLPNMGTERQLIEFSQQYDITINMISSKLLPKPYKTMCHYYNSRNNGIMSREDCIDNCVVDLYRDKCECRPYYLTNAIQLLNSSTQSVCSRQVSGFSILAKTIYVISHLLQIYFIWSHYVIIQFGSSSTQFHNHFMFCTNGQI